ncbi:hypothetical protein D1007_56782 [Hordeum vulgare]|nr:hypothetical protein D1007_56782 [Hordeum vulgare]
MHAMVGIHKRFTELSVVYTNNPVWVEQSIHIMELLFAEEKYKVVWFDLEYTRARSRSRPKGSKKHEKDSLVHLAEAIIDPYYRDMKDSCNKDKCAWHSPWMEKLEKAHIVYAAKEAYTSYEMYMWIVDMRKCLLPQNGQGSNQKQSNGKRHHNKK